MPFASALGGLLGKEGGQYLGGLVGNKNLGGQIGGLLGGEAGKLLPFKTGGRVPGKRGRPKKALVHGGEYILPVGVQPTLAQKKAVAIRKKKAKKGKK